MSRVKRLVLNEEGAQVCWMVMNHTWHSKHGLLDAMSGQHRLHSLVGAKAKDHSNGTGANKSEL